MSLLEKLDKAATAIYLAAEEPVANDIAALLDEAANEIQQLTTKLEQQEILTHGAYQVGYDEAKAKYTTKNEKLVEALQKISDGFYREFKDDPSDGQYACVIAEKAIEENGK